jgi:hypothetical protein
MVGLLNAASGGLAAYQISDPIVSPPEFVAGTSTAGSGAAGGALLEMRGLLPPCFVPNSHKVRRSELASKAGYTM